MILVIWPIIATISASLYSLFDMNLLGIYFSIFGPLISIIINYGIKYIVNILSKDNIKISRITKRPYNLYKYGCGYFKNCEYKQNISDAEWLKSGPYGFPSGHAQFSFLFATFWSLYLYERYSNESSLFEKIIMIVGIISLYIIAILVCFQRVHINCHTPLQVTIGSIIGLFLGYAVYKLIKLVMYYTSSQKIYENIYKKSLSLLFIMIAGFMILGMIIILFIILFTVYNNKQIIPPLMILQPKKIIQ